MTQPLLRNPAHYPFLAKVKNHVQTIREEYLAYINDPNIDRAIISTILKAKSSVIKPGKLDDKHQIYPFYLHRQKLIDIIKTYQLTFDSYTTTQIAQALNNIETEHFQVTQRVINEIYQNDANGILDVYFSVIAPHVNVKLHINNDPYIHRAYLGIIVPEGDIMMKIAGQIVKWVEDDFVVLDVDQPHCPHNHTNQHRITLNIDFYRPEQPREKMAKMAQALFAKRMQTNPYGYGLYGTDDAVTNTILAQYGEYGERMLANNT